LGILYENGGLYRFALTGTVGTASITTSEDDAYGDVQHWVGGGAFHLAGFRDFKRSGRLTPYVGAEAGYGSTEYYWDARRSSGHVDLRFYNIYGSLAAYGNQPEVGLIGGTRMRSGSEHFLLDLSGEVLFSSETYRLALGIALAFPF
jgi:hypothetical protein